MCFSKGGIGCCPYNIRRYHADGTTAWARRWSRGSGVPNYHAAGPDGRIVVVGEVTDTGHHMRVYDADGAIALGQNLRTILPSPDNGGADSTVVGQVCAWIGNTIIVGAKIGTRLYRIRFTWDTSRTVTLVYRAVVLTNATSTWARHHVMADGMAWLGYGNQSLTQAVTVVGSPADESYAQVFGIGELFGDQLLSWHVASGRFLHSRPFQSQSRPSSPPDYIAPTGSSYAAQWGANYRAPSMVPWGSSLIAGGHTQYGSVNVQSGARVFREVNPSTGALGTGAWPTNWPTTGSPRGTSWISPSLHSDGLIASADGRWGLLDMTTGEFRWLHVNGDLQDFNIASAQCHADGDITISRAGAPVDRVASQEFVAYVPS